MESAHVILGVPPDASGEELTAAYRELAKRHHPDVAGEAGEARMAEINAAYTALRERPEEGPEPTAPAPLRARLDPELLAVLGSTETVLEVATGREVQVAVTDRRLLWLRDDLVLGRVRMLRLAQLSSFRVEHRWRRVRLALVTSQGTTVRIDGLAADPLHRVVEALSSTSPEPRPRR